MKYVAVVLLLVALFACASMEEEDRAILDELSSMPSTPQIRYVPVDDWTLRVIDAGRAEQPQVVFLHGGPGSLDNYTPYFEYEPLARRARLTSLDRPGYGGSGSGRIEPSVARQAALIRPLLSPGAVVVGHSFGATVAARLAMDYPDLVSGLVLVAGSLSPVHERPFFFTRAFERPVFNWMLSDGMRMANAEKFTRTEELEAMAPLWDQIQVPVILIHGTRDRLVPHSHSEYAADMLPPDAVDLRLLDDERHFILWTEVELIAGAILELLRAPANR